MVVRWHSFRRSPSLTSAASCSNGPTPLRSMAVASLTVGQFSLLRKLALLRLTALLERHTTASNKPSWGWDLPKFMRKIKAPDFKGQSSSFFSRSRRLKPSLPFTQGHSLFVSDCSDQVRLGKVKLG